MADVESSEGFGSATTADGFTAFSNVETSDAMAENFASEGKAEEAGSEDEKLSKAASALGKKGGKASAESKHASGGRGDTDESASEVGSADDTDRERESDKPLGKPRDDPKARMLEATRKEAQAKRERDQAIQERERLAQELAQERAARQAPRTDAAPPPKQKGPDDKPSVDDFDNYEAFVEANSRWAARQEYREAERRAGLHAQAQAYAQSVDRAVGSYKERIDKVRSADPEFMDRVSSEVWDRLSPTFELQPGQQGTAYNVIADEVMQSEHAPAILLHFTEHPAEFQRIASLQTPRAISREMAKLETRFEAATADISSKPSISKAKPPVRSVTGSPSAVDRDEDSMSFEEFVAHDAKRSARR